MEKIDVQAMPKEIPTDGIEREYTVVVSRFEWVFREEISVKDIDSMAAEILYELMKIMPMNGGCSYIGKCQHEPKLNQMVLLWLTTFKSSKSSKIIDDSHLETVL